MNGEKTYKYDAFISYRHKELDKQIAKKLQKLLETFKPPKNIEYSNVNKINRVFRDQSELPTSGDLGGDILEALEQSRFLIVIFSEDTIQSRWCMEEIRYFKELHNGNIDRILTVLVNGDPQLVFPDELRFESKIITDISGKQIQTMVEIEPLAANVCQETTAKSLRKLKIEFLRIAAPVLGCSFDDLYQRHRRRKIRNNLSIVAISFILMFSFLIYYTYNESIIKTQTILTQIDVAERYLNEGNKLTSLAILNRINEQNSNPDDYIKSKLKNLMFKATYIPQYQQYAGFEQNDNINDVVLSDDGSKIYIACANNTIIIRDGYTGLFINELHTSNQILKLEIDKNTLYAVSDMKTIELWDLKTFCLIKLINYREDENEDLKYFDIDDIILGYNEIIIDSGVSVDNVDLKTGEVLKKFEIKDVFWNQIVMDKIDERIVAVDDINEKIIISYIYTEPNSDIGKQFYIAIYDLKTQEIIQYNLSETFCYENIWNCSWFVEPYNGIMYDKQNQKLVFLYCLESSAIIVKMDINNGDLTYLDYSDEKIYFDIFDIYETSIDAEDNEFKMFLSENSRNLLRKNLFYDNLNKINVFDLENNTVIYEFLFQDKVDIVSFINDDIAVILGDGVSENLKFLFVDKKYKDIYLKYNFWNNNKNLEKPIQNIYEIPNSYAIKNVKTDPCKNYLVCWDDFGSFKLLKLTKENYFKQSEDVPSDLFYFKTEENKYYNSSVKGMISSRIVARSADGNLEIFSSINKQGEYQVNEKYYYWLADASINNVLYNINIPYKNINAIDIENEEIAYVLTSSNLVSKINMKTGGILSNIKIQTSLYFGDNNNDLYLSNNQDIRFEIDSLKGLIFISSANPKISGGLYSLETGELLCDFSSAFSTCEIAVDVNFNSIYIRDCFDKTNILEYPIPDYQELVKRTSQLSQGYLLDEIIEVGIN